LIFTIRKHIRVGKMRKTDASSITEKGWSTMATGSPFAMGG